MSTTKDSPEAKEIGKIVVRERLAACTNVIPGISSTYRWRGKIEEAEEALLLAKTTEDRLEDLISRIEKLHSYETPEAIAIRIEDGSTSYLKWVKENVK